MAYATDTDVLVNMDVCSVATKGTAEDTCPNSTNGPAGGDVEFLARVIWNTGVAPEGTTLVNRLPVGALFRSVTTPAGVSCTGGPAQDALVTADNREITCQLAAFSSAGDSGSQNIQFRVTLPEISTTWLNAAEVRTSNTDVNSGNNTLSRGFTTRAASDLKLSVVTEPATTEASPIKQGQPYTQTVTVNNAGPTAIPSEGRVVVGFTVPQGASVTKAGGQNNWTCTPAIGANSARPENTQFTCTRSGSFANGASSDLVIVGTPNVSGSVTTSYSVQGYRASGTSNEARMPDGQPDNNTAAGTVHVSTTPAADLMISKQRVGTSNRAVGETVNFTLRPRLQGGSLPTGSVVIVRDTADSGLSLVGASADPSWTCSTATQVITCSYTVNGTLAPYTALPEITVSARLNAKGEQSNTATISTDPAIDDPVSSNNSSSATVTGSTEADLQLLKTASTVANNINTAVGIGVPYTYSLRAYNHGPLSVPSAGTNNTPAIEIAETIPVGVTIQSYSTGAGWTCTTQLPLIGDGTANNLVCRYENGLNIENYTSFLTFNATRTTSGTATNTACVRFDSSISNPSREDSKASNNCDSVGVGASDTSSGTPVEADLALTKTADKTVLYAGEELTYTLTVRNLSATQAATNVRLSDALSNLIPNSPITVSGLVSGQSCTPQQANSSGAASFTCELGTLEPNSSQNLNLTIHPTTVKGEERGNTAYVASSDIADPNLSNNTAEVSLKTQVNAFVDLVASKQVATIDGTGTNVTAPAGSLMRYTVRATNQGPSSAENVWLRDTLPADTVLVSSPTPTQSAGQCRVLSVASSAEAPTNGGTEHPAGAPGGVIECVWGTPTSSDFTNNGQQREVTYSLRSVGQLPANTALNNVVTIGSATTETNLNNNTANARVTLGASELDVQVEIIHDKDALPLGDVVTYTIRASNTGPSYATQVVVQDTFPSQNEQGVDSSAQFGYIAGSLTQDGGADVVCSEPSDGATSGQVQCTFPLLAPDEEREITFQMRALSLPARAISGSIFHKVTITPSETEYLRNGSNVLFNNQRYDQTSTNRAPESADLSVVKTHAPTDLVAAQRGQTVSYTLTATNHGPNTSYSAVVVDTLPAGFVFQSASGGECSHAAGSVSCNVGVLTTNESISFTVTALVPESYAGANPAVNTATVVSDGDPNPSNNTSSVNTPVEGEQYSAVLRVVKTLYEGHDNGLQCPGVKELLIVDKNRTPKPITWCFAITNTGASALVNPEWNDPLLFTTKPGMAQTAIALRAGSAAIIQPGETAWYFVEELRDTSLINEVSVTLTPADEDGTPNGEPKVSAEDGSKTIFGYLYDPPFGVKTGEQVGNQNVVRWTMVWVNDNVIRADNVWITDPPPVGMTMHGNVACSADGDTVVRSCEFEAPSAQHPRGRVRVNADFGIDYEQTVDTAANALRISFDVLVNAAKVDAVFENQATSEWTPPGSPGNEPLVGNSNDPGANPDPNTPPAPSPVPYDSTRVTDILTPPGSVSAIPLDNPWALLILALGMLGLSARRLRRA